MRHDCSGVGKVYSTYCTPGTVLYPCASYSAVQYSSITTVLCCTAGRKQKKTKEKRDRTRSLQKCQRDGYDRMEEWWHFVKGCETLHNQTISKISTTTTSTSTSSHTSQHFPPSTYGNTTQYHTSNNKCKSIDSHTRMGRCRLLSRNPMK